MTQNEVGEQAVVIVPNEASISHCIRRFPQECNHPPCGLAASFNPSRNAFLNAKPSFIKCGCKRNPTRLTVERDEAHSVTKAESVLSQGYEQLSSVFRKGMPVLIQAISLYTSCWPHKDTYLLLAWYRAGEREAANGRFLDSSPSCVVLTVCQGWADKTIPLRAANTFLHLLSPSRRLLIRSLQGAHTPDSTLV
ncbi:hypothetical protein KUCAC02_001557, partial [Chaenocephalus aceratus]